MIDANSIDDVINAPESDQLEMLRELLKKTENYSARSCIEDAYLFRKSNGQSCSPTVVVLLHGIRTAAVWQCMIQNIMSPYKQVIVYPVKYGYFDAIRFWLPFLFRSGPVSRVCDELRQIKAKHPSCNIVVLAHSYATYIVSKILKQSPDVKIDRLLLCGSIIPSAYKWSLVPTKPYSIVNDVGTRDCWPVLAKTFSWGYGPSGRFGFGTHHVNDRYYNLDHSGFFSKDHVQTYWVPFFTGGHVVVSEWGEKQSQPNYLMELLSALPSGFSFYIIVFIVIGAIYLFLM